MPSDISPSEISKGRMWYFLGGVLCAILGGVAIARPGLATVAIEQFLGAFFIISGVVLLFSAAFGHAKSHRLLDLASCGLRLAVGILLIAKALNGVIAITLVLASVFLVEGVFGLLYALKTRARNPAWVWILVNSVIAFLLGGLLLAGFPADARWAVGLYFGINSLFLGVSLVAFAAAMPGAKEV